MQVISTVATHILVSVSLLPYMFVFQADPKCSHPTGQYMQSNCSLCPLRKEFDSVNKIFVFKIISHVRVSYRSMRANQP